MSTRCTCLRTRWVRGQGAQVVPLPRPPHECPVFSSQCTHSHMQLETMCLLSVCHPHVQHLLECTHAWMMQGPGHAPVLPTLSGVPPPPAHPHTPTRPWTGRSVRAILVFAHLYRHVCPPPLHMCTCIHPPTLSRVPPIPPALAHGQDAVFKCTLKRLQRQDPGRPHLQECYKWV